MNYKQIMIEKLLKGEIAINIGSRVENNIFLNWCKENNINISNNLTNWNTYKENTCYQIENFNLYYNNINYFTFDNPKLTITLDQII